MLSQILQIVTLLHYTKFAARPARLYKFNSRVTVTFLQQFLKTIKKIVFARAQLMFVCFIEMYKRNDIHLLSIIAESKSSKLNARIVYVN